MEQQEELQIESGLLQAAEKIRKAGVPSLIPALFMFNLKGNRYTLTDHFMMEPMFSMATPRKQLFKTSRQVGKSQNAAASRLLRSAVLPYYNVLFVCPRFEQTKRLSNLYIRPLISQSIFPDLLINTDSDNSVLQRTFSSGSSHTYSFAFLDCERIRGISSQEILIDESLTSRCVSTTYVWPTAEDTGEIVECVRTVKKISEIKVGDILETFDNQGKVVLSVVEKAWCAGERECFRITLEDGSFIEGTLDHYIPTTRGYMRVEEIIEYVYRQHTGDCTGESDYAGDADQCIQPGPAADGDGDTVGGRLCVREQVHVEPWPMSAGVQLDEVPDIVRVRHEGTVHLRERRIRGFLSTLEFQSPSSLCLFTRAAVPERPQDGKLGVAADAGCQGAGVVGDGRRFPEQGQAVHNIDSRVSAGGGGHAPGLAVRCILPGEQTVHGLEETERTACHVSRTVYHNAVQPGFTGDNCAVCPGLHDVQDPHEPAVLCGMCDGDPERYSDGVVWIGNLFTAAQFQNLPYLPGTERGENPGSCPEASTGSDTGAGSPRPCPCGEQRPTASIAVIPGGTQGLLSSQVGACSSGRAAAGEKGIMRSTLLCQDQAGSSEVCEEGGGGPLTPTENICRKAGCRCKGGCTYKGLASAEKGGAGATAADGSRRICPGGCSTTCQATGEGCRGQDTQGDCSEEGVQGSLVRAEEARLRPVRIARIDYVGKELVYDLKVAGTNTFFANNIAVHNCQDMNFDFLPVIAEVLSGSKRFRNQTFTGTPKTFENTINKLWMDSSMAEWATPCSCGKWNIASLDQDLLKMIGLKTVVCAACGKAINPRSGCWVHAEEKRRGTFAGYHISQVTHPYQYENDANWAELLTKMRKYPQAKFYNECLGETWDSATRLITTTRLKEINTGQPNDLKKALSRLKYYSFITMGIDWGGGGGEELKSYTAVTIAGQRTGTDLIEVLYAQKLSPTLPPQAETKELLDLIKWFNPTFIAHDYGGAGAIRETLLIQAGVPANKIIPFTYVFSPSKSIIRYVEAEKGYRKSYTLDKPRSLVVMCTMMRAGKVLIPTWDTFQHCPVTGLTLGEDVLNLVEERTERAKGSDVYLINKVPGTSDDFAHSLNYACSCIWYSQQRYPNVSEAEQIRLTQTEINQINPSKPNWRGDD